jgi:uncharacterized membrane protein
VKSAALYACGLLISFFGVGSTARAAHYAVTLLHPSGFDQSNAYGAFGTQQVGYAWQADVGIESHAMMWDSAAGAVRDLHPANFVGSQALGASSTQQIGHGYTLPNTGGHALLWSGSAESVVDLHPEGFELSFGWGISENSQVGYGFATEQFKEHALLWHGSAASVVDLHPEGFLNSLALGVHGASQVGGGNGHALLWHGSAASVVDLHPTGFLHSIARAVHGSIQVGEGFIQVGEAPNGHLDQHALLWQGSAESVVDLHPAGYMNSRAYGASSAGQVGQGSVDVARGHALVWQGNAASAIDLHEPLAEAYPFLVDSMAIGISENGSIVGYATDERYMAYAVLWTPVPEPSSCALLLGMLPVASMSRRYAASS